MQPPQPQMRSFDMVTPASAVGGRDVRNTSVQATRGRNTSQRNNLDHGRYRYGGSESQEPRKLSLSPVQQEEESSPEHNSEPIQQQKQQQDDEQEAQLLQLPPSLFPHWCVLMLLSALCLAAVSAGTPLTTNTSTAIETTTQTQHYENLQMVMAIATLSLMLTFLAAACYVLIPASFVGSLYEVTVIGLNIVLHSGNLPIVMNPENDLAVQGTSIVNGNLFLLSWSCFFMSWALLKLVLEQAYCMDQARNGNLIYLTPTREGYPPLIPITPYRMGHIGLILSSLVVLVSSARGYKQQLCSEWNRQLCKRLQFSIGFSVLSLIGLLACWSVFLWYQKHRSQGNPQGIVPSTMVRLGLHSVLAFGWFVSTAMGTFGKHGPGHALGNYFFGVWISLYLSLYLFKKTLLEHLSKNLPKQEQKKANHPMDYSTQKAKQHSHQQKKTNSIPGLILDDDNDNYKREQEVEEEVPMSVSCTDDMMESVSLAATPALINPKAYPKTPTLLRSSSKQVVGTNHDKIAISLEESFRNEDPEHGMLRILRKTSTEKTEEVEEFDDDDDPYREEVDFATEKTPKRGSATRSVSSKSRTGSTTTTESTRSHCSTSSDGEKSDFYHERIKPTSIPFASGEFDTAPPAERHAPDDEVHEDYDLTMVVDNTSTAQRDVLIDPDDFSRAN